MWFQSIDKQILFTKNDKEDPRLGEFVQIEAAFDSTEKLKNQLTEPNSADIFLLGYADDDGISLNGGRIGAAKAPLAIRTALFKMTPHLQAQQPPHLHDLGDINLGVPLPERHERARAVIRTLVASGKKFIALGGGHDYGYADAGGFLDVHQGQAVVINFDAHLDVRPTEKNFHSGTPFFRMLSEFSDRVKFIEVGLQNQCNSQSHFRWAQSKKAELLLMDDLGENVLPALKKSLDGFGGQKLFISLDMDVFTASEAPGCSQSWVGGMTARSFFPALRWLCENFEVAGLGIYETSPPLDLDNRTSKLAALVAHDFIFHAAKSGTHR